MLLFFVSIGSNIFPAVVAFICRSWEFEARTFVDRSAADLDEESVGEVNLQPRFGGDVSARKSVEVEKGRRLGLGFGVGIERYPETRKANRLLFNIAPDYTISLSNGTIRQLHFFSELTHARDDSDWVYNRVRVGGAMRLQLAPRNTLQLRARFGYRDQNEDHTFRGYDQSEYLFDLTYNRRSSNGVNNLTAIAYFEYRDADFDRYTYAEIGARFIGRHKLSNSLDLVGRANAFSRDYESGGREDRRFRGTVGIDWNLAEDTVLGAFAGVQTNWSTFDAKDYGGGVFGVELTKKF